ncbi:hypothetical protein [Chitinibacter sp. S2-10]|uniref:hypothetical protein n=1 Tax=Chitinibacter sp. S2-10 TaxID=3373597 RepID=UPI003977336C
MLIKFCRAITLVVLSGVCLAAEFATPGGAEPGNIAAINHLLRQNPYDMELLISFGTSKGGSAGHLALAIRQAAATDDTVYSANFYADHAAEHQDQRYVDDLMISIPKMEYLFKTTSSLGDKASFGLDFGEVYKRSVIGIRIYGVPETEKQALAAYFSRINADFQRKASDTEYQRGEVKYGYMDLNCAKTIGSAFKYGAGYEKLAISSPRKLGTKVNAALNANLPTEMALKLIKQWQQRGYRLDTVLYQKFAASNYVDPLEEELIAFKDLPNRFPSVLSLDFAKSQDSYRDYDNLYAMHLLSNLGKYRITVDGTEQQLELIQTGEPLPFDLASKKAKQSAKASSHKFRNIFAD